MKFPADYFDNLDQVTCTAVKTAETLARCAVVPGEANTIRIEGAFQSDSVKPNTEVAFLLWNVRNPVSSIAKDSISNEFAIVTVSPDGYPIDAATSIDFAIGCTFPCATCAEEQNKCLSCLTLDDGTPLNYFAEEQTCLPECPVGYLRNKLNVCEKCDSRCATCSSSVDFCDTCKTDSVIPYLEVQTGYCQSKCPVGTYVNQASMTCEPCVNNCRTCNGPDFCIDCKPGFFFLNDQCLTSCPVTAIQFDTKTCQSCTEPCYTCEGTVDTCTSCIPGFYFHNNECVSECPSGYQVDDQQTCYRASEMILPFITMAAPVVFLLAIAISNTVAKTTKPITAFIALQSSFMVGFWVYQMIFLLKDKHNSSPILIAVALVANYACNCIFYEFLKNRLLHGKDKKFNEYQSTFPATAKCILNFSMLSSFQLFRFQYSGMCGKVNYLARFENRMKYYKRINRYTLFQITFVYLPVMAASAYNLFYTWYGRQIFWIDIECILMSFVMIVLKVVVIIRNQSEYIRTVFDTEEFTQAEGAAAKKYLVPGQAKMLANAVVSEGFTDAEFQRKIVGMSDEQRQGTLRALFDRIFAPKQSRKDVDGYRLKHGRGVDMNRELYTEDDVAGQRAYAAAGVTVVSNYKSEVTLSKSGAKVKGQKMAMYSSVGAEERRRAAEIQEERDNLEYQKFNNNDVTATLENPDGTLGATQAMEQEGTGVTPREVRPAQGKLLKGKGKYNQVGQDTTQMDDNEGVFGDEDGDGLGKLAFQQLDQPTGELRRKDERAFHAIVSKDKPARRLSDDFDVTGGMDAEDHELFNFQSAPQNAKSALEGNQGLKERYEQFQRELQQRGVRQARMHQDGRLDQIEIELANRSKYDSMPIASQLLRTIEEDSDDLVENFNSSQWGHGTSKVIAQHYNTVQQGRKLDKLEGRDKAGNNEDGSRKLTPEDFKELISVLQQCRQLKKSAK